MKEKNIWSNYYGDEVPGWKDVFIVIIIVAGLIAIAWVSYFKLGWLH